MIKDDDQSMMMPERLADDIQHAQQKEAEAEQTFRRFIRENKSLLSWVSHWGDGRCGFLSNIMQEEMGVNPAPDTKGYTKKNISQAIRTQVFERDAYRCVFCGDHKDLCADHIYPESLGGQATIQNLQTLCRRCNSVKGASAGGGK